MGPKGQTNTSGVRWRARARTDACAAIHAGRASQGPPFVAARRHYRRWLRAGALLWKGLTVDDPQPKTEAELRALKEIRRHKRNLRKAWADGYLTGICAQLKPGDLAVDCGANVGVVTTRLAATGAAVIAFEPDPDCYQHLVESFGAMPNVTLVNAAVGARKGKVKLMRALNFAENPSGASVKSTVLAGGRGIDADNAVEVAMINFPAFVKEKAKAGGIRFLKLDIEGAELDILDAMERQGLFRHVTSLVAETHERKFPDLRPRYREMRQLFAEKYAPSHVNLDWI